MASHKTVVVMMLLSLLMCTPFHTQTEPKERHTAFHTATDSVADVFGDILYPIQQLWGKIINTFSPHHPILKDIRDAADHVGQVAPRVAQEITKAAEEFTEKAKIKAREMSDYALEQAEQTTKRICDDASQRITESSTKALANMQETIEMSVHNATENAVQQIKQTHEEIMESTHESTSKMTDECTQKIEESIDRATKQTCADINETTNQVMNTIHQELKQSATDMAQEFEIGADRIVEKAADRFGDETEKSVKLAAKASVLAAAGSASLAITALSIYKCMYDAQNRDLGFIAVGLAGTVASYKALDKLSK